MHLPPSHSITRGAAERQFLLDRHARFVRETLL
jgi:hypothetical protein